MSIKHDESKLPKWVQQRLSALRHHVERIQTHRNALEIASAVLHNRNWITLQAHNDESRTFYILRHDSAVPMCTIYKEDIVLVGRYRKRDDCLHEWETVASDPSGGSDKASKCVICGKEK